MNNKVITWLIEDGLRVLIIIVMAFLAIKIMARIIRKAIKVVVRSHGEAERSSELKREQTLERILVGAFVITVLVVALLMILQQLGVKIGPILAGAGIVGLAVGFGGQYLIRDLISGLFIVLENQYRIGDVVTLNSTGGLVEDITLRMTTLRDMDGTVHHVPHGEIKIVANLSKRFARVNINLGISYSEDLDKVIGVINRVGQKMADDDYWGKMITSPPVFLRVEDFGDSAIILKIVGETLPIRQWEVSGELRKRLKQTFDKEGIEIPFPQRVIHQATG
ncbi:MAG TPA: mechanosensitive ion channel family protein [Saprospiraceae bacterium]|nr:mechanosensitive ion channel family protein [Saprospiraceae bacterium]